MDVRYFGHRADVGRDGHLVVVEHDDEIPPGCAGVIEAFVRQTAGQRSVAEDGNNAKFFTIQIASGRHAEPGGDGRRRVSGAKRVVLALRPLEESGEAVLLTQRLHSCVASGEKLVRIALMTDVPHELIARRVEARVERDGQLDNAQSGADVAAGPRADLDESLPDRRAQLAKLVTRELLEVLG